MERGRHKTGYRISEGGIAEPYVGHTQVFKSNELTTNPKSFDSITTTFRVTEKFYLKLARPKLIRDSNGRAQSYFIIFRAQSKQRKSNHVFVCRSQ
jgi:hypothetical protein